MEEIWKPIVISNGKYEVSSLGRVRNVAVGNILKQQISTRGYFKIGLHINGDSKHFFTHRLVCAAFYYNPENKPQVNHKDCNQLNNTVENLEWVTAKENTNHAQEMGRMNIKKIVEKKGYNKSRKQIINIETNEIFDGAYVVCKMLNTTRKKIARMLSGERYNNTPYRYLGEESKNKIPVVKEKGREKLRITVFDLQWQMLKTFDYKDDFLNFLNFRDMGRVNEFLNGKISHSKGYKFKLNNEDGSFIEPIPFISKKPPLKPKKIRNKVEFKPLKQYDLKGNFIKDFISMGSAAKELGVTSNCFRKAIRNSPRNFYKGFIYKLAE